jgi:hypothetical protein
LKHCNSLELVAPFVLIFFDGELALHHQVADLNGIIGLPLTIILLNARRSMGCIGSSE